VPLRWKKYRGKKVGLSKRPGHYSGGYPQTEGFRKGMHLYLGAGT
jgi:hypothetical protein